MVRFPNLLDVGRKFEPWRGGTLLSANTLRTNTSRAGPVKEFSKLGLYVQELFQNCQARCIGLRLVR